MATIIESWAKWEVHVMVDGHDCLVGQYATKAAAQGQATRRQKSADRYNLGKVYRVIDAAMCDFGSCVKKATHNVSNDHETRPMCKTHAEYSHELLPSWTITLR